MKNRFCIFFLLIAIVIVLVLGIIVFLSLWSSFKCPDPGMMRVLDYFGIEQDLCYDPAPGARTGLAVNPYQADNSERNLALIIGSSVSYIISEVKYFTLFIVVLTVLALNVYALIVYFVLDKIIKPETAAPSRPETRFKTMGSAVMGRFNSGKDPVNQRVLFK